MWSHSPERTGEGRLPPALESSAGAVCAAVGVFLVQVVVVVVVCVRAHTHMRTTGFLHLSPGRYGRVGLAPLPPLST